MFPRERFVDIHCHLLPGLDNGPSNWEESVAMAEMAAKDGIAAIVCTPHQLGNFPQNTPEIIRDQARRLQRMLLEKGVDLQVLPGADIRIDPDLPRKLCSGQALTLADRGRHVLLELPHELYISLDGLLKELRVRGIAGILSHPERNGGIIAQPEILPKLVRQGCLMQITAGSLLGVFGSRIRSFTEWMIKQRLVDFVATDAHDTKRCAPLLSDAFQRVAELADVEMAVDLCCRNAACVAAGLSLPQVAGKRTPGGGSIRYTPIFGSKRQS